MTEKRIAERERNLVLEGEDAFRGRTGEHPPPCVVRHEDAGGQCYRPAVMRVYGLAFCEIHGAEVKTGALEELYHDAANFIARLDNDHVPAPNPAAVRAMREAVEGLRDKECEATLGEYDALRLAFPLIKERVDEDTLDFDYQDPERGATPLCWNADSRMLICKLMRLAHEAGDHTYLIEILEEQRERVSAQLAFALALREGSRAKSVS